MACGGKTRALMYMYVLIYACVFLRTVAAGELQLLGNDCPDVQIACHNPSSSTLACDITDACLGPLISEIPETTTNLSVTVDTLTSSGASFSRLASLTELQILWKYSEDDLLQAHQNKLENSRLFEGLKHLTHLKIAIPVTYTIDDLLLDLDSLTHLDFTDFAFYSTGKFAKLITGSNLTGKPLTHLTLKRISGVLPGQDRVFQWKDLMLNLKGAPLRYLDISDNREAYLYPTFIQNIPDMQTFIMRYVTPRYKDSSVSDTKCAFIEILMHQNLTSFDMTGLGVVGSSNDVFGRGFILETLTCMLFHGPNNTCICKYYKANCGKYYPKPESVDCSRFPEFDLNSLIRLDPLPIDPSRKCDFYLALPIPKQWKSLKFGQAQLLFNFHQWNNLTTCFTPNNVTDIDFSYVVFKQSVDSLFLVGFENVENFDLAYSSWGFYFHDPRFLHQFPKLQVLNLTSTTVGVYLKNDTKNLTFSMSSDLRILHLKDAHLTTFQSNIFLGLGNLIILDLSSNRLNSVTFNMTGLVSLQLLNLSSNLLHQLDSTFRSYISGMIYRGPFQLQIDIQYNPFTCDCESIDFLEWLRKSKLNITNKYSYLCTYFGRNQRTLIAVNTRDLWMKCNTTAILVSSLVGAFVVIIFMTGIIFKFRWKLRTFFLKIPNSGNTPLPDEYKYHAFVIYADENREWVHNNMLDEMEKKRGLSLCIHHRDFIPGENIHTQIAECIDTSRKTILILTKEFIKSEWCMFEMSVARNLLPSEGRDVVVPILLAELPRQSMKPEVKTLVREKTYLQWETSIEGQEYFWNRLTVALGGSTIRARKDIDNDEENIEEYADAEETEDESLLSA